MTYDLVSALLVFAFVTSITPGPNNLMLLASGANFGLRRSAPHLLGICLGLGGMIVAMGLGLSGLFELVPAAKLVLAAISVVYLLWLAWKIATAAPPEMSAERGRPMTFLQSAAFQWVNPKAWTMALSALSIYSTGAFGSVLVVALAYIAVGLPSMSTWTLLGQGMARILTSPGRLRAFNWTMAGLLVVSLWPSLAPLL